MSKRDGDNLFVRMQYLYRAFFGNLTRIFLLILTDIVWCVAVQSSVFWVCCRFSQENFCGSGSLKSFGWIAGIIVLINISTKCYHGNALNPGAAINRVEEIRRITLATLGAFALGYFILRFSGGESNYPVLPLIVSAVCTAIGFPVVRFFARLAMKKAKVGQIRVFIAGAGNTARKIGEELATSTYYGYEIVGFFDDDVTKKDLCIGGKKYLGRICDAPRLTKKYNTYSIICCLPPILLPRITKSLMRSFRHVLVIPSSNIMPITAVYPTMIGLISGFELQNRILFLFPRIFKRLVEIGLAIGGVVLLLPLFAFLAILVKISSRGPVFYTAKRLGIGGKEIKVFKFRTMYQDADFRLESMLEENPVMKTEWEKQFKLQNDPRVTRIGRFLRKTSLDELPQLINVIRGEMALVGPRPIVSDEICRYKEAYDFLKFVRPGVTGLWQVSGRSDVSYDQRVAMDMFYVMNWSFWLDWYILWKTVLMVLICRGSY